ncbi:MAG: DUF4351 domain-containing protein [Anaerolineae bacterium]|nr:DUF4351 domain-containing protein [Gloeobacterales cyanobacterium ES-bin-313]
MKTHGRFSEIDPHRCIAKTWLLPGSCGLIFHAHCRILYTSRSSFSPCKVIPAWQRSLPSETQQRIEQLSLVQLETLGLDLLDFKGLTDLHNWLAHNQ